MPRLPDARSVPKSSAVRDPGIPVNQAQFPGVPEGRALEQAGIIGREQAARQLRQQEQFQKLTDANGISEGLINIEQAAKTELARAQSEDDTTDPAFVTKFGAFLDERTKNVEANSLKGKVSDQAFQRFQIRAQGVRLGLMGQAQRILGKQRTAKASDLFNARTNSIANKIRGNPAALDFGLEEVDDVLGDLSDALDPNSERDERLKGRVNVIESAVLGLADAGQLDEAEKLVRSDRFNDDLTPKAKDRLLRTVERKRAFQLAEVTSLSRDHLASLQTTGQGIPGFSVRARAAMSPERFAAFRKDESLALDFFGANDAMKFQAPKDMLATLNRFRPRPGAEGFADRNRLFTALQSQAKRLIQNRAADPAGQAQLSPEVQEVTQAADGDQSQVPRAVQASLDMQARMGVPKIARRTVSRAQAQGIITNLQGLATDQRAQQIAQLQEAYGPHYLGLMKDLTDKRFNGIGLDPRMFVLSSIAGDPALSQLAVQVMDTGSQEIRKGLEGATVTDTRRNVQDALQPWMRAVRNGAFGSERDVMLNGVASFVEDLALFYVKQGESASDAAERAASQVINDRFTVQDTYYVPKRDPENKLYSVGSIDGFLTRQKTREKLEAFGAAPFGGGSDDLNREATLRTAVNSGFWVTNATGTGAFLVVPVGGTATLPLLNADGELYEFSFREASDAQIDPLNIPDVPSGVEDPAGA